jgi:hypothetical protein
MQKMNLTCAMRCSPEREPAEIEDKKSASPHAREPCGFSTVETVQGHFDRLLIDFQGARSARLEMATRNGIDPSSDERKRVGAIIQFNISPRRG